MTEWQRLFLLAIQRPRKEGTKEEIWSSTEGSNKKDSNQRYQIHSSKTKTCSQQKQEKDGC